MPERVPGVWMGAGPFLTVSEATVTFFFPSKRISRDRNFNERESHEHRLLIKISSEAERQRKLGSALSYLASALSLSLSLSLSFFNLIFFWPHHVVCGNLVPQTGTEQVPSAMEVQSLNHWTTREVLSPSLNGSESYSLEALLTGLWGLW